VDTKTQDWIEETLLNSMEWYYNAGTTKYKHTQDPKAKDTHQFIHSISNGADKGKYYPLVEGILTNIQAKTNMEITEVCRIKANFLQPTPNWNHGMYHIPHVDIEDTTGDNCDYLSMIYYVNNSDGDSHWYISASMHGYGVSLLCAEQKIHASFCKCYYHSYANYTNILAPLKHGFKNVAFLLGIGYRDDSMPYYKNINKPDYNEIVTWK